MDKTELKNRIASLKNQIITNSKDAHWMKNAISELLSAKGQLDHIPSIIHTQVEDIVRTMKGDNFELHEMKDGSTIFHVYGGYTVVADTRAISLNEAMRAYLDEWENISNLTEEEKTNFELSLSAFVYVMSTPLFAFTDVAFTFDIASMIVTFLRERGEKLLEEELKDETLEDIDLNHRFKDATMALEEFKEEIDKVTL